MSIDVRRSTIVVPMFVAAVVLAACGGNAGSPATDTSTTTSTTGSMPAGAEGVTTVEVTESEFAIQLAESRLSPGMYTFEVRNTGQADHDLVIRGPGVDERTPVLAAGESGRLMVTLSVGAYELWCSVGNHREQGMDLRLEVAAAPSS